MTVVSRQWFLLKKGYGVCEKERKERSKANRWANRLIESGLLSINARGYTHIHEAT